MSLLIAGIAGFVIMAGLLTQWKYISEDAVPGGGGKPKKVVRAKKVEGTETEKESE